MADLDILIKLAAEDLASPKVYALGDALGSVAGISMAAVAAGVAGLAAGLGVAVNAAAGFEQTMSGVKAVSGATADQMAQLSGLALQLGKDTVFSAADAGRGLEELVKSGVSVQDIMGGAAKATLNLATAGGVDLVNAAQIASNALNSFNLTGQDMAHVSDVIAGAANASAIDVNQFGQAMAQSSAVAATVGVSFDDLSVAIAEMGNAGIKGQDAGTSLKTMLLDLTPNTKQAAAEMKALGIVTADGANRFFDAEGHAKGLADISQVLQDATKNLTDQQRLQALQTIFGTDAIRASSVMAKDGAAGFDELAASMSKVTAESVAAERLNNLKGDIEQLKGSVETASITLGETFQPQLRATVQGVTSFVNELIPFIETYGPQFANAVHDAGAGLLNFAGDVRNTASGALQFMADRLADAGAAFAPWAAQAGEAGVSVDKSLTGTSEVVQALQFLLQGNFKAAWDDARKAMGDFGGAASALRQVIDDNKTLIFATGAAFASWAVLGTVVPAVIGAVGAVTELAGGFATWMAVMGPAEGALGAIVALLGGPVTLAIAGVAIGVGLLALAWQNNFGDIQGKTAEVGAAVGATLDQFGTDLHTTGVKAATLRDDINAAFDPINDNIDIKVNRWSATIQKGWDLNTAAAKSSLATFATTVQTGLDPVDTEVGTWQVGIHNKILEAFSDSGIEAQIQTLARTIDAALNPITARLGQWQVDIRRTFDGIGAAIDSAFNADTPTTSGGPRIASPGGDGSLFDSGGGQTSPIPSPGDVNAWRNFLRPFVPAGLQGDDRFLDILLAGGKAESGLNATRVQDNIKPSLAAKGLFQFDPGGMGANVPESQLFDPSYEASRIVPEYAKAYQNAPQGLSGADLAAYVAGAAERPGGWTPGAVDYATAGNYRKAYTDITGGAGEGNYGPMPVYGPEPVAGLAGGNGASGGHGGPSSLPDPNASKLKDLLATENIDWTKTLQTETNRIAKSVSDENTKLTKADVDAGRATTKVDTDSAAAITAVGANRGVQDDITQRKNALAQQLQDDQVANNAKVAAQELTYQRGLQNDQIAQSRKLEDTQIATQQALAAQQLTHSRTLEDQEIVYQQGLQKAATVHERALQDAQIVSDKKLALAATEHQRELQDQQTEVNAKLAAADLAHQRALQDAAIPVDQGLQDVATGHSRQLQDQQTAYDQQKSQTREAAAYQLQLSQATSDAERAQITANHNQTIQNMALQAQYAAEDLAHSREVQDEEAKYQEGLQQAALARSRAAQDDEIKYQAGVADQTTAAQRVRDDAEAAYQQNLAAVALAKSRVDEDTEQAYKENLQKVALDHSRALQDTEILYQNDQAKKALDAKRVLEDAALVVQRNAEDAAIKHKADMEAAAREFAKGEKAKQDALDRTLADEADKRAIEAINTKAALDKKSIAENLDLQKRAIIEASQLQLAAAKTTFDEAAAAIIEKSRIAVTKAGGDFDPIEATMKASVAEMDGAFATAHDNSGKMLIELAGQTLANLGDKGVIPTAITDTAKVVKDQFGVSDRAVELFAQQFGVSWDVARPLLGDIEKGVYTNLGANGLIPNHINVSNQKVIEFAKQWGISWPEAAGILTTESGRIKATFGEDGEVPKAMAASETAASDLNTAIQGIQDKTVTVTTNYISNGSQAASGSAGASPGAQTGSRSGGGEATGGPGPVAPSGDGGSSGDSSDDHSSPSGQHIGESGPGGIYNDPSTGHPYTHAKGGVTTGPIGGIFGEAGPEAIIPLGDYFVSRKSDAPTSSSLSDAQMMRLAQMIAGELAKVIPTEISVSRLQSAALQLQRRGGSITLP